MSHSPSSRSRFSPTHKVDCAPSRLARGAERGGRLLARVERAGTSGRGEPLSEIDRWGVVNSIRNGTLMSGHLELPSAARSAQ